MYLACELTLVTCIYPAMYLCRAWQLVVIVVFSLLSNKDDDDNDDDATKLYCFV